MIKFDSSKALIDIDFEAYKKKVEEINSSIDNLTGEGNDFLGWADYPLTYDKEEFERIKKAGKFIQDNFDVLVVCGIGGSYLGARAAIEAINGLRQKGKVEIIYFGQTFSPHYVHETLEYLKDKNFAVNVISKSGTTTETAIGFRLLREMLEKKLGKQGASKAIFATTDKEKGALLELSKQNGYERFVLPSNIGGRYSVYTAVGLLPMAAAGIDIDAFMKGAFDARKEYANGELNDCYRYAIARHELDKSGKKVEMFVSYEPRLVQLGEWWKQLFGESEGKGKTGILPDSATFSTDLHSLGQFVQDGTPLLFETVIDLIDPLVDVAIPHDEANLDGLNYLDGKGLDFVNKKAMEGTMAAHVEEGKVPNLSIKVDRLDAYGLGFLMYFFMRSCAMACYLNGINPFNQPGVEIYKKNMFHLLGKPGY